MPLPRLSFEFFPPKTIEASLRLGDAVRALGEFGPRFVSVTQSADPTARQLTLEAAKALGATSGLSVAAHLTCVGATREETIAAARAFASSGVKEFVALRGDPPKPTRGTGTGKFVPHPDGFETSVDLVAALRDELDATIRVAAYPDPHPDTRGRRADLDWLKRKFDAGAKEAITQFFLDPEAFLRFRDDCAAAGIRKPVVPGIFPIENWDGVRRFARRCGVPVPPALQRAYGMAARRGEGRDRLLSVAFGTSTCDRLIREGVDSLHFYTFNRSDLAHDICLALGFPKAPEWRMVA